MADILRARILAIACGYEDGNDLDQLRFDPGFKLACGRLPESGGDLCSQPTVSRWENAPTQHEMAAMNYAMNDIYCASYARPPRGVTLDIDDIVDVVEASAIRQRRGAVRLERISCGWRLPFLHLVEWELILLITWVMLTLAAVASRRKLMRSDVAAYRFYHIAIGSTSSAPAVA